MTLFITEAKAAEEAPAAHGAVGQGAEATHAEVGHAAPGEHGGAFPPFDPTYFGSQILWLAITFGFLYWYLSKKILPRMEGILETRQDRIGADLAEAERFRTETDAAIAAYEQALAEARQKAGAIAGETRAKVATELDARRKAVDADLGNRLAAAEARIADIKSKALAEVDTIATDTTAAIVETLIGSADRDEAAGAVASVRQG